MYCKAERPGLMPRRANSTDAGLDLKAKEEYLLLPFQRVLVGTGVSVKIPVGHFGMLVPRSSLSKNNIILTNSVGIIDADYRGEIIASLMFIPNMIHDHKHIDKDERIVQLVIVPCVLMDAREWGGTDYDWFDTERGSGGFGSTGKN